MSMLRRIVCDIAGLLLGLGLFGIPARGQVEVETPEVFRDGSRWCFLGDGFVQNGSFVTWCRAYLMTRFPGRVIEVFNAGVAGDVPERTLERLPWDVLPLRPTQLAIAFGEAVPNLQGEVDGNAAAMRSLVGRLREAGAHPWIIAPVVEADDLARVESLRRLGHDLGVSVVEAGSGRGVGTTDTTHQARAARNFLRKLEAPRRSPGCPSISEPTGLLR